MSVAGGITTLTQQLIGPRRNGETKPKETSIRVQTQVDTRPLVTDQSDITLPAKTPDSQAVIQEGVTKTPPPKPEMPAQPAVDHSAPLLQTEFHTSVPAVSEVSEVRDTAKPLPGEGIMQYLRRTEGEVQHKAYQALVGAAGPFKEGDQTIGVAATSPAHRLKAQQLLANTRLSELQDRPLHDDEVFRYAQKGVDKAVYSEIKDWTVGQLKNYVLDSPEADIKKIMPGLPSDAIGSVVKLMDNDDLVKVGQKVFNPLPGSNIGAKGYLSARLQPNSPTDNPEDVVWQVFNGWSYGVGDLMLGTNPVGGSVEDVTGVEESLKDLVETFELQEDLPWCVLSHIDTQDKVEKAKPGSTALFFQSIAGTESANQVFDVSTPKMAAYAKERAPEKFDMYLETGQGADFTNGQDHGVDMGTLEARKYGLARSLKQDMGDDSWVAVNDVAGFIGPEVFKSKEQLVRVALEDTVMGKLHGLTIGLDICSTLHMDVGLKDLDWAMDQIMPANPAYLMALPTKSDPMLGYLTTSFQDHVRLRNDFGYKINEPMQKFFQKLDILDDKGKPTEHFGDPVWVYSKYRQAKNDQRPFSEIYQEGQAKLAKVVENNVPIATGHGENPWDMKPQLASEVESLVARGRESLYSELEPSFVSTIPNAVELSSKSPDRHDYILRPTDGESLSPESVAAVQKLAQKGQAANHDVQIVISDGLNAKAISQDGNLNPFLETLRKDLAAQGHSVAPENLVVRGGRVRAGYRIGEMLFGESDSKQDKTVVHVIGERPGGTPNQNYSAYIATAPVSVWAESGKLDHDRVTVISGISATSLDPSEAASQVAERI